MRFKQLDSGLYEGIAEEADFSFQEDVLKDLFSEISRNSPDLLRDLATRGFASLPSEESEKLKGMLEEALAEVKHGAGTI